MGFIGVVATISATFPWFIIFLRDGESSLLHMFGFIQPMTSSSYSQKLPVKIIERKIIFGAYDNIIYRFPTLGRLLRAILQWMEHTPLKIFGLSHFWVIEKVLS